MQIVFLFLKKYFPDLFSSKIYKNFYVTRINEKSALLRNLYTVEFVLSLRSCLAIQEKS